MRKRANICLFVGGHVYAFLTFAQQFKTLGTISKPGLLAVQKLLQEAVAARAAGDVPKATSKIGTAMDTLSQLADGLDPQEAALMRMLSAQFRQALTMGDTSETQRVSDVMRKRSGATIKKKP